MTIGAISLQGIQMGWQAMERYARMVADPQADGEDLVRGLVGMQTAGRSVEANAKAFKVQDERLGTLLDVFA